ncbi:hypothetical protein PENSUB_13660 [Penicillium subrubescens]|uniref:EXPERA domain-containing protein n=1 Tax=Penicillium subrubescens TaxID=1316194 RepID=A0A1Q5SNL6_9EURO|nr:hypothetical protein PENSUB_13660 [Penicillium subrubescens]
MVPLTTRRRDCAYLLFFASHIPIIFLIDTVPLQPSWMRTELSAQLREYYVATYKDKFFEDPAPVWFSAFIWMELLYHVPASLWAVWGLWRGALMAFDMVIRLRARLMPKTTKRE